MVELHARLKRYRKLSLTFTNIYKPQFDAWVLACITSLQSCRLPRRNVPTTRTGDTTRPSFSVAGTQHCSSAPFVWGRTRWPTSAYSVSSTFLRQRIVVFFKTYYEIRTNRNSRRIIVTKSSFFNSAYAPKRNIISSAYENNYNRVRLFSTPIENGTNFIKKKTERSV